MLCVLNHFSKPSADNDHQYLFWYGGDCVKLIADKPFGRGDLAHLMYDDPVKKTLEFKIVEEADDVKMFKGELQVPLITFATTRPVDASADYEFKISDKNSSIMRVYEKVLGKNKVYCLVLKLLPGDIKVIGTDRNSGTVISIMNKVSIRHKSKTPNEVAA